VKLDSQETKWILKEQTDVSVLRLPLPPLSPHICSCGATLSGVSRMQPLKGLETTPWEPNFYFRHCCRGVRLYLVGLQLLIAHRPPQDDSRISMKYGWYNYRGKLKFSLGNLSMDNTVYHRSHKHCPGIQAKPPQWDFSHQVAQLLARPYLVGLSSATMHI